MELCRETVELQTTPRPGGVMSRRDPAAQTWCHHLGIHATLGHTRLVQLLHKDSVQPEREAMGFSLWVRDQVLAMIDNREMVDLEREGKVKLLHQVEVHSFHQHLEVLELLVKFLVRYCLEISTMEVRGLLVRFPEDLVDKVETFLG